MLIYMYMTYLKIKSGLVVCLCAPGVNPVTLQLDLDNLFQLDNLVLSFKVWLFQF